MNRSKTEHFSICTCQAKYTRTDLKINTRRTKQSQYKEWRTSQQTQSYWRLTTRHRVSMITKQETPIYLVISVLESGKKSEEIITSWDLEIKIWSYRKSTFFNNIPESKIICVSYLGIRFKEDYKQWFFSYNYVRCATTSLSNRLHLDLSE